MPQKPAFKKHKFSRIYIFIFDDKNNLFVIFFRVKMIFKSRAIEAARMYKGIYAFSARGQTPGI